MRPGEVCDLHLTTAGRDGRTIIASTPPEATHGGLHDFMPSLQVDLHGKPDHLLGELYCQALPDDDRDSRGIVLISPFAFLSRSLGRGKTHATAVDTSNATVRGRVDDDGMGITSQW